MAFTRPKAAQIDFDVTNITDPLIRLNSGQSGTNNKDTGLVIERGSDTNVALIWDESTDSFAVINTSEDGSTSGDVTISSYADLKVGQLETTGELVVGGNLTVQGTTTTVDVASINITNSFSFEGATPDGFETTLTVADPTADRTITLPDVTGYAAIFQSDPGTTLVTATVAELNYVDGVTSNIQTQIDNISSSFTLAADSGTNDTFTTGETLTIAGGTGIDTTVSDNNISIAIDSTVATLTGTQTLTNKTITSPTISNPTLTGTYTFTSDATSTPAMTLTANSINDGVGALRINGSQADIFLNPSTATHTTITFAVNDDQRLAFGMDNNSDFYITRRTSSTWYDDTFVLDRDTGLLSLGYGATVAGTLTYSTLNDGTTALTSTVAELNYVDGVTSNIQTQLDAKLALAGGTMSGAIAMGTNKITGMGDPTAAQDAATKAYVDSQVSSVPTGDITAVNITAGTGLSGTVSTASGDHTQTLSIDSTVVTLTGSQTLTNKTLTSPTITGTGAIAGTFTGNITGDVTGNADTATALATARNIAGQSFDGTANITIASTDLSDTSNLVRNNQNNTITSTTAGSSAAPEFELFRDITGADSNYIGQIKFSADNDANSKTVFAKITGKIGDASDGTEDGIIEIAHIKAGSQNINVRMTSTEFKILNGTDFDIETHDGSSAGLRLNNTLVTSTAAELNILDGVTATASELNIIDGDTSATSTTLADADRVVVNDAGTMKQVALTDFETYFETALDTLSNVTSVGTLNGLAVASTQTVTMGANRLQNVADPVGNQDAATKAYVDANAGSGGGSSGFTASTTTTAPGSDGDFDLSFNVAQTTQETPFESGGSDAFGVSLGEVYDQMEPVGSTSSVDLGVLT